MVNKTVKQIVEENKGKEIHLIDGMGTWGELPLTENNMQHTPDAVEINDNVVKMYISWIGNFKVGIGGKKYDQWV